MGKYSPQLSSSRGKQQHGSGSGSGGGSGGGCGDLKLSKRVIQAMALMSFSIFRK